MSGAQNLSVENEGAALAYDWEGEGPLVLTIAGGGGDAPRHAALSAALRGSYTVVRYDRRCSSRSTGDPEADLDMAQQARDAVAVIRAMGQERAFLFGNSGGASIALKVAEDSPDAVLGLALHEPPILPVLPDGDELVAFMDRVEETFRAQGVGPAMGLFSGKLVGFDAPLQNAGQRVGEQNRDANLRFFLAHEVHNLCRYAPDLARIRAAGVPALLMRGERSADAYYARTAPILAAALDGVVETVPGNHVSFIVDPAPMAEVIDRHFARMAAARP